MTAPNVTIWRHATFPTDENGFLHLEISGDPGTHAISGGGYANGLTGANGESTDEGGNDVWSLASVVAMRPGYDSTTDKTSWYLTFAAPPGCWLRVHAFAILAA